MNALILWADAVSFPGIRNEGKLRAVLVKDLKLGVQDRFFHSKCYSTFGELVAMWINFKEMRETSAVYLSGGWFKCMSNILEACYWDYWKKMMIRNKGVKNRQFQCALFRELPCAISNYCP